MNALKLTLKLCLFQYVILAYCYTVLKTCLTHYLITSHSNSCIEYYDSLYVKKRNRVPEIKWLRDMAIAIRFPVSNNKQQKNKPPFTPDNTLKI